MALDDVLEKGIKVIPSCWFVRVYIDRHQKYKEAVAWGGAFTAGLPRGGRRTSRGSENLLLTSYLKICYGVDVDELKS